MKKFRQFINVLKDAFKGMWRNKAMAIASTVSIAAMLILFGMVFLSVLNVNSLVYQTTGKIDKVIFYLNDDIKEDRINELISEIAEHDNVKNISYVSKEEAKEQYRKSLDSKGYVLDSLKRNVFPASLVVVMDSLEESETIIDDIKDEDGIESYNFHGDIINKMLSVERGIKILGLGIVSILVFVSVVIINNTIKIAVSNRKREISIMKYLGATDSYIRGPFLIEGCLFGVFGACISYFAIYKGYGIIYDKFMIELMKMDLFILNPKFINIDIFIMFLAIGVCVGYLGSLFSTKKFLDV